MRDLEYELIGSTQYLNKSRACENLRFYFPFWFISSKKQNFELNKEHLLEGVEEEVEHEKE